jgi:hypothetical protein
MLASWSSASGVRDSQSSSVMVGLELPPGVAACRREELAFRLALLACQVEPICCCCLMAGLRLSSAGLRWSEGAGQARADLALAGTRLPAHVHELPSAQSTRSSPNLLPHPSSSKDGPPHAPRLRDPCVAVVPAARVCGRVGLTSSALAGPSAPLASLRLSRRPRCVTPHLVGKLHLSRRTD